MGQYRNRVLKFSIDYQELALSPYGHLTERKYTRLISFLLFLSRSHSGQNPRLGVSMF
jgi:hypothetical protein